MKCYDLLVIGATFTGIGAASSSNKKVLVVDNRSQVGYEFINSYKTGCGWNGMEISDATKQLEHEMQKRGLFSPAGIVNLPPLAPILYDYIRRCKFSILLMTEIIDIKSAADGYEIRIFNTEGFGTIRAADILDTTTSNVEIESKTLNAFLYNPDEDATVPESWNGDIEFVQGNIASEAILKLKMDVHDDWTKAREKIHRLWAGRPRNIKSWTIAAVADCFDISAGNRKDSANDGLTVIPSCSYHNPLEAFEAGVGFAKQGGAL